LGRGVADVRSNVFAAGREGRSGGAGSSPLNASQDWEDSTTLITQHQSDRYAAAWVLTRAPVWFLARRGGLIGPIVLGLALAAVIVAMIVFAPSADSHFIYTDF
jgi:hypothetical protein